ncbi:MAG: site-specific DNA-methyltransferase [bacterium]
MNKQKLELTWIGKGLNPKLEPRILIEDPEKSYGDKSSDNMLIHGDNLLALKALEQDYSGKIKCIYIDPPYNTGSAFEHYDDNLEHSTWLNLMRPRLEILKRLLKEDGSIWISIDDDEQAYLKVLCDEVFNRSNFINNIIWQKKFSPQNDAKWLSDNHDFIMVYAKNKEIWRPNLLNRNIEAQERYKNPDNDVRGEWTSSDLTVRRLTPKDIYEVTSPNGNKFYPPVGRSWGIRKDEFQRLIDENRIWFGKNGGNMPRRKKYINEVKSGITSMTVWPFIEVGHNQDAKKEMKILNSEVVFETPKPEKLIEKILNLGSNPGDFILDSFLGSGTTAAVAHKMNRKWIGIEIGEHATTHCLPRLKKVIDGNDGLPLSEKLNWKGGGGFKFYDLAPSLISTDKYGKEVINKEYNPNMLASAMCKHMGFKYSPDLEIYWKQGQSTETDYIFTTTQYVTVEMLDTIAEEMKPEETLLICSKSYDPKCEDKYPCIDIKKIPQVILGKCEFGKDNYDLNIIKATEEKAEDIENILDDIEL